MQKATTWARWTTRRRRPILLGALAASVLAGALACRLPLRGDLAALLPPDARSVRDLESLRDELRARKARANPLYVALDDDAPAAGDARLADLKKRVDALRAAAE